MVDMNDDFWYCSVNARNADIELLEKAVKAAEAAGDFEAKMCLMNDIATLKGEEHPYTQEDFYDL